MPEDAPRKHFTPYPLAAVASAFALGIVVQSALSIGFSLLATIFVVAALAAYMSRRSIAGTILILVVFLVLGSLCFWIERNNIRTDRIQSLIDSGEIPSGDPVELTGRLCESPEPTTEGSVLTLAVENITYRGKTLPASGTAEVYSLAADEPSKSEYEQLDLRYGSRISVACNISREEEYQNPGVTSRIELLDRRGLDATATLKSPLLIEKLEDQPGFGPLAWTYESRASLIDEFRAHFSTSTAGVLSASMLGDKYFLDKSTADIFREGGTFHILVISGLHITFIGGILLLIVRTFSRKRLWQFILVSSFLWMYTFAVGANVPVVRASVMFTVMLFSQVLYRQGTLLNSLGACVLLLLAWRPTDIFNPSFQLTVASVAAIVGIAFPLIEKLRSIGAWMPSADTPFPPNITRFMSRFCEMLYWRPAAWNIELSRQVWSARIFKSPYLPMLAVKGGQSLAARIFEGIVVSFVAQMSLLPFMIIYFHRVTPVGVVMNLWAGVVMALESFSAFVGIAVLQFSEFLARPFIALTELLNHLLVSIPKFFVNGQWSSWRVPNYSGPAFYLYTIYFVPILIVAFVLWKWDPYEISKTKMLINIFGRQIKLVKIARMSILTVLFFSGVLIFHPFSAPSPDGRLRIDFLDIGQGDSALITFPEGTTMLIDGGGQMDFRSSDDEDSVGDIATDRPGIGEAVVSPVLWNKGYSRLDYVLATHADADHIQGLSDVAANFAIGEAFFGRMPTDDPEFEELATVLRQRGVPSAYLFRGQTLKFGSATVEVLYPRQDTSPSAPSDNNHSVVIRIVYGNRAFLLTGDIEREAESALVDGGGTLRADLIKVPHHGSRTSSTAEFVDSVKPEYAVISVGRHSRFGHPHPEVVERWSAFGAKVMTTGARGMISISTDGSDLSVQTFK
jgi:competence protein ComEC